MPIPPSINKVLSNDAGNPASYPGTGTLWTDTSGSVDLTLINSPTFVATPGYFDFSGANRSAEGTGFPSITVTGPFSFNTWFKIDGVLGNTFMLIWGSGIGGATPGDSCGWTFLEYAGNLAMFAKGAAFYANVGSYVIGKWHQFTCTVNASGDTKCYVDGVLTFTQLAGTWGSGSPAGSTNQVGGSVSDATLRLDGDVALIETYDIELTAGQVADVYLNNVSRFFPPIHEYDAADPASYPGYGPTFTDIGSAPINLTINNATFDNVNDSFTLQGNLGSYIRSAQPISTGLGANNFSYQMWFQFNGQSNLTGPVDPQLQVGSRGPGDYGGCTLTTVSGQLVIESPGIGTLSTGFSPVAGKWYLITLTVNGSNLNTVYVDGVSIYTGTLSYGSSGTINSIALGPAITNLGDASFSGFGPVQIYDRVISPAEITNYYNSTLARFNPAVHAYDAADPSSYPGSGSTLSDIGTATAINLTINDATFNATNDSFTLDGTLSSYIRSANSLAGFDIGGNDFSVQYWFKYNAPTVTPPYSIFLQIGSRTGPGGFSGFTHFMVGGELNIGKPGVADYATGFYPTIDQWYQITMTVDSSDDVILYVDSASEYTQNIAFVTPANILAIGDNGIQTDQVFDGSMGPLFLFDRVLSPAEITTYYNSTVTRFFPPPPPAGGNVGGRTFGQGFAG